MTIENIEAVRKKLEAEECGPNEQIVWVGMELYDHPHTRHMSWGARQILNQIPVFEKRPKPSAVP